MSIPIVFTKAVGHESVSEANTYLTSLSDIPRVGEYIRLGGLHSKKVCISGIVRKVEKVYSDIGGQYSILDSVFIELGNASVFSEVEDSSPSNYSLRYVMASNTLGINKTEALRDWWEPFSANTSTFEAGGSWNDWVVLARHILRIEDSRKEYK